MRKHSLTVIAGDRHLHVSTAVRARELSLVAGGGAGAGKAALHQIPMPAVQPSWEGFCALALMPVEFSETSDSDPAPFRIDCSTPKDAVGWTVFGVRSLSRGDSFSANERDMVVLRDCASLSAAVTTLLTMMRECGLPAYYREIATPWICLPLMDEADTAGLAPK
jgi:hypothetical protein